LPGRSAQSGILIVGAGLAGLTLALSLARAGIKTTVIEKQKEITPSRWGILLYPVGMKIFHDLGVLEDVKALAMPLKDSQADTPDGKMLAVIQTGLLFEQFNFHLGLGPSEIREVLRRHAIGMGVEVMEGVKYLGLLKGERGRVIGASVSRDGEEFTISCDLLVGADGYKSKVREDFGIEVESRNYSPVAAMFIQHEHGLDRFHMVLADGYQVAILPFTPDRLVVGLTERSIAYEELVKRGEGYVKDRIEAAAPYLSSAVMKSPAKFSDDSLLIIEPAEIWAKTYAVDGGVLIGDAAHSFHPGTGQGAQQAFLDATMLASVVQTCLETREFSRESLMNYEKPRIAFMRFWKGNSRRLISMETAQGRFGRWLRDRYFRKITEISNRKEMQEILIGFRAPTRMELLRISLYLLV
jgi:2-polyprenyl-6-methoxyphenol hydroxylase-like FAD-dependent oxidoreductase